MGILTRRSLSLTLRRALVQAKRAGLRYGSGMDNFDFQLQKRDEQLKRAAELCSEKGIKVRPVYSLRMLHRAIR